MRVIAYDPYIATSVFEKVGAEKVSLDELLAQADVITVHTPLTDETRGMIGAAEIAKMKDGVIVLNIARGGIYDEQALADALNSGKIAGAAIDVYVEEPPKDHPLLTAKNIILSPHIGANTIEAQDRVAVQTRGDGDRRAARLDLRLARSTCRSKAWPTPTPRRSSSWPRSSASSPRRSSAARSRAPRSSCGASTSGCTKILSVAALKGLLTPQLAESVNFVNAEQIAQQRGIAISSTTHPDAARLHEPDHVPRVVRDATRSAFPATLFSEKNQRIVSVNNFRVEFKPEGNLLYIINKDVPGVVGKVGTLLGDREINIAEYNLARNAQRRQGAGHHHRRLRRSTPRR